MNNPTLVNADVWRHVNALLTTKGIGSRTPPQWDREILEAVVRGNMKTVAALALARQVLGK